MSSPQSTITVTKWTNCRHCEIWGGTRNFRKLRVTVKWDHPAWPKLLELQLAVWPIGVWFQRRSLDGLGKRRGRSMPLAVSLVFFIYQTEYRLSFDRQHTKNRPTSRVAQKTQIVARMRDRISFSYANIKTAQRMPIFRFLPKMVLFFKHFITYSHIIFWKSYLLICTTSYCLLDKQSAMSFIKFKVFKDYYPQSKVTYTCIFNIQYLIW
jgi:hypothetical protein